MEKRDMQTFKRLLNRQKIYESLQIIYFMAKFADVMYMDASQTLFK